MNICNLNGTPQQSNNSIAAATTNSPTTASETLSFSSEKEVFVVPMHTRDKLNEFLVNSVHQYNNINSFQNLKQEFVEWIMNDNKT